MPEQVVCGGEIWLHSDEIVLEARDLAVPDHIGLITTRASGYHYASVLRLNRTRRGYAYDVPQWEYAHVDHSVCASLTDARAILERFSERYTKLQ